MYRCSETDTLLPRPTFGQGRTLAEERTNKDTNDQVRYLTAAAAAAATTTKTELVYAHTHARRVNAADRRNETEVTSDARIPDLVSCMPSHSFGVSD